MMFATTETESVSNWPREAIDVQQWSDDTGLARLSLLSPDVMGVELHGYVSAGVADFLHEHLTKFFDSSGQAHMFWDTEKLQGHAGAGRDVVVKMLFQRRSQWQSVHVLYQSALIGVTVTALSLALGSSYQGHKDRAKFMAALEQTLAG
ncbi:MAG: hypothetical protein AAF799_34265 [Myxococcota bacterium]